MRTLDDAKKRCSRCGVEKSLGSFHPRKDRPSGRNSQCKECDSLRARVANQTRTFDTDKRRRQRLAKSYGLTNEQLDEIEKVRHCKACGRTAEEVGHRGHSGRRLHVDHNHKTGKMRGLLCKPCNSILGMAQDDPARLRALAVYLEAHSANS